MTADELGFETLAWDPIRRWQGQLRNVELAITELRSAPPDSEEDALLERLRFASARARDAESYAIEMMKTYGHSDGVDVPGAGVFRVVWHDDGLKTLEPLPP